jgi:hypothetical protein
MRWTLRASVDSDRPCVEIERAQVVVETSPPPRWCATP